MKNKIILIWILILITIVAYYYQLELATLAYLGINILINNLEYLSNHLKDYLDSNNISVELPTIEDNTIKDVSADNKLIDSTLNNSNVSNSTTQDCEPFYKTKTFWILSGITLIVVAAHIYKLSLGDTYIQNNVEINNITNLINQEISQLKTQKLSLLDEILQRNIRNTFEFEEKIRMQEEKIDSIIEDIKSIFNLR